MRLAKKICSGLPREEKKRKISRAPEFKASQKLEISRIIFDHKKSENLKKNSWKLLRITNTFWLNKSASNIKKNNSFYWFSSQANAFCVSFWIEFSPKSRKLCRKLRLSVRSLVAQGLVLNKLKLITCANVRWTLPNFS